MLISIILSLDSIKNVHYYLASSCIILFTGLAAVPSAPKKNLRMGIIYFLLIYFITYDAQLVYAASQPLPNKEIIKYIKQNTTLSDNIVLDGIDLKILNRPQTIEEQIQSVKEIGGTTGIGLQNFLKRAKADSSETRNIFMRVTDYFWTYSKYKDRWLIGLDTVRIHQLEPKFIVVSERFYNKYKTDIPFITFLENKYEPVFSKEFSYFDRRLEYRNYFYFHSVNIFKRKK